MRRQRWVIGVAAVALAVLAVVALSGARGPGTANAAPGAGEDGFPEKVALKVTMKSQALHFEYMDRPVLKKLGGREFILGQRVSTTGTPTRVYLPVDNVSYIEEYATREDLIKANPNLGPAEKK